ncbi:hypothetical protein NEMBOFW57_002737 [Staphylotrichum longicolle]|uniref:Uncharacterized protein n=1 Tax=Staphylotrichum longicolle TaxID=669026 RepID=A0AAD4HYY5_9PEZI|nr:hypothetical protein NEMBOFW57_002737 [Staphylotrichum longicolle]
MRGQWSTDSIQAGDFFSSETVSPKPVHRLNYSIEVESFSVEEIQGHLAGLLSAYRAFFLEPDEEEPPRSGDAESAERSRGILRAIFGHQLGSAENEDFLLQGEEEDVLDALLKWTCESHMNSRDRHGPFEDPGACLVCLDGIATVPFVKNILLEGTVSWQMGNIQHGFLLEIEELEIA